MRRLNPTRAVRSARCACTSRCTGLCREPRAHQAVAAPWRQSAERGGAVRAQVCRCVHFIGSTSATRKSAPRRCAALLSSHAHGECCNTPPVQLVGGGRGSAYCLMPSSCHPARCRSVLRNKQPPCVCHLARAVCSAQRDRGVVRQHNAQSWRWRAWRKRAWRWRACAGCCNAYNSVFDFSRYIARAGQIGAGQAELVSGNLTACFNVQRPLRLAPWADSMVDASCVSVAGARGRRLH